jgi:hypothetical protein
MKWKEIKTSGSKHYKKGVTKVEPIDLFKDGGILRDFAVGCVIKYAYRNRRETGKPISPVDIKKIKHYCDMLLAIKD